MTSRPGRLIGVAAIPVVVTLLLAGCGAARSVANYCSVFYQDGQTIRQNAEKAQQNGDLLSMLSELASSPAQLADFFDKLDAVAPDDIEPDVAQLRDAFKKEADSVGSTGVGLDGLIGSAANGLMLGLSSYQAAQHVDSYTSKNCGPPPGSSSSPGSNG